jgi:hypothetical protein
MSKLKYKNIAIKREKIKPNVAANFLGGANMGFGFNLNNLETLFAIYASGEVIFVNDLSAKSRVRNIAMNIQLNANVTKVAIITRKATILITFSFNWFGDIFIFILLKLFFITVFMHSITKI